MGCAIKQFSSEAGKLHTKTRSEKRNPSVVSPESLIALMGGVKPRSTLEMIQGAKIPTLNLKASDIGSLNIDERRYNAWTEQFPQVVQLLKNGVEQKLLLESEVLGLTKLSGVDAVTEADRLLGVLTDRTVNAALKSSEKAAQELFKALPSDDHKAKAQSLYKWMTESVNLALRHVVSNAGCCDEMQDEGAWIALAEESLIGIVEIDTDAVFSGDRFYEVAYSLLELICRSSMVAPLEVTALEFAGTNGWEICDTLTPEELKRIGKMAKYWGAKKQSNLQRIAGYVISKMDDDCWLSELWEEEPETATIELIPTITAMSASACAYETVKQIAPDFMAMPSQELIDQLLNEMLANTEVSEAKKQAAASILNWYRTHGDFQPLSLELISDGGIPRMVVADSDLQSLMAGYQMEDSGRVFAIDGDYIETLQQLFIRRVAIVALAALF